MYINRLTTPPLKNLSSITRSSFFTILSRPISSTTPNLDQTEPKSTDPKPQRDRSSSRPIDGSIDASSSVGKSISLWPGRYDSPVINALWEARSSIFERSVDASIKQAPSRNELLIYKFSTDYVLREQYRDPGNEVRIGELLEDLDALAGTIAFKHCSDTDSMNNSLLRMTASVDRIVLKKHFMLIFGAVTYVGRSSIDIQIEVTQLPSGANYTTATDNHIWE